MLEKKFLKFVTTLACIVTLIMPHASVVLATAISNDSTDTANYLMTAQMQSAEFHENGYSYTFGGDGGTPILKISHQNDQADSYEDVIYCLDGNNYFPGLDEHGQQIDSITYKRTIPDLFASNPTALNLSTENYNSLNWLISMLYLKDQTNVDDLLNKAFHDIMNDTSYEDTPTLETIKGKISDVDIDVIQQWAIWYFTNYGEKTLQNVSFTNDSKALPVIDLKQMAQDGTVSMSGDRKNYCNILYKYLVEQALSKKNTTFSQTSVTYPAIVNRNITCAIDGNKYKIGPFKVSAPSNDLTADDYELKLTDGTNTITEYTVKDDEGNTINKTVNEIFGQDYYIYLPLNTTFSKLQLELAYTKTETKASVWQAVDNNDEIINEYQPLVLITRKPEPVKDSVDVNIIGVKSDLALRKYIVKVNNTDIDRKVSVNTSNLKNSTGYTTAEYYGKKSPVDVKLGDTVTFKIEVFNEGDIEATATEIIDYLPTGLEFIEDNSTNTTYGWHKDDDGKLVTQYLADKTIPAFDKTTGENGKISSKFVEIVCKVAQNNVSGNVLTNIAEIKADNINDGDSHPDSIKTDIDLSDTDNYTGKDNDSDLSKENYYYKGQEDDDDFEKVKVVVDEPKFDLSLQKFITKRNGKEVKPSREPVVDTTPLKNGQNTATYTTPKEKLKVQVGDIITYKIRVYNEGEVDGYAEKVADYIPEGLGYLVDYKANNDNKWTYPEDAETIKLSDVKNGTKKLSKSDFNNIESLSDVKVVKGSVKLETDKLKDKKINAFDDSDKLKYEDIEVTCIVLSDSKLKNIAEITVDKKDNNGRKEDVDDRDSEPDDYYKDDKINEEDDDDYEELVTIDFDLALQKFITKVNDTEIKDREPQATVTDGKITYTHTQTPLKVKNGDKVTYTIRVYNEGPTAGYAAEIGDNIPSGLKFDKENAINKKYGWKMYDQEKNETDDASKAVEIRTDYLSKEKSEEREEDALLKAFDSTKNEISAKDIKVVFTVDTKSFDKTIINIAEITKDTDENGDDITDKDSEPDNGDEDEDDLDKERIITDRFDLSLQKFITKINGKEVTTSREPKVDTTSLKNGKTDATYTTVKNPLIVKKGDIVTYKIRVYNEGELNGYAETVADYLPEGLGYLVNYNTNIDNYWALPTELSTDSTVKLSTIKNGTKNLKTTDFTGVTDLGNVDVVKGKVKLTSTKLSSSNKDNLLKAFDSSDKLDYKDIEVTCIVLSDANLKNIAEVTKNLDEDKKEITDADSTPDTVNPDNYPGDDADQDDNDYETLTTENKKFDLALQKFITGVNGKTVTDREPKATYNEGKISYTHPQTPLEVNTGDSITYTIRVYNEGDIDGYAAEIADNIPTGLTFDQNNEINKKYGWVMFDADKNMTNDVSKAVEIRTDYLSKAKSEARKENTLIKAFDSSKGDLSYFDVQAVFTVSMKSSDGTVINTAEITKDTDEDGNDVDDVDSTPDNKKDGEDDTDKERIHVGFFDLALVKDLQKAIITEDGKTREVDATDGKLKKIEIHRKKIDSTVVKFVYNITIKNEGTVPGYAKEITDYIPEGLEFVQEDNKAWTQKKEVIITTEALANTLIQPGQSVSVQVVLKWKNGENNLGLKTNVAEISKDYNDAGDTDDVDSTPNNKKDGEDDIDDAPVILSISTGKAPLYLILSTTVLVIISAGVISIKKRVLNK